MHHRLSLIIVSFFVMILRASWWLATFEVACEALPISHRKNIWFQIRPSSHPAPLQIFQFSFPRKAISMLTRQRALFFFSEGFGGGGVHESLRNNPRLGSTSNVGCRPSIHPSSPPSIHPSIRMTCFRVLPPPPMQPGICHFSVLLASYLSTVCISPPQSHSGQRRVQK